VTGSATLAPFAGTTSAGAAGVDAAPVFTVSVALRLAPRVPVITADVDEDTACVLTVKVPLVLPAGTVTLPGTVAAALLLESVTTRPPDGAAAVSVTVPCDVPPPATVDGLSDTVDRVGVLAAPGVTVSTAPHVVLRSAHTFAGVLELTADVVTGNVALVAPAGIVTLAGTEAGLVDDSCTFAPPGGAAALIVTVATDEVPAVTVAGVTPKDVTHTLTVGFTVTPALALEGP